MRGRNEREREREGGREGAEGGAVSTCEGQGGCNTCTWHGQCIRRYPTNARNWPPSGPPSAAPYLERVPNFPIAAPRGRPPYPAMTPFPPPRILLLLLPADACNSPMLNATFASLHSARSTCLPPPVLPLQPPPPPPPSPPPHTPDARVRDGLCTVYASSASTCLSRAHTVFIDSCQSFARGSAARGKSDNEDTPAEDWSSSGDAWAAVGAASRRGECFRCPCR